MHAFNQFPHVKPILTALSLIANATGNATLIKPAASERKSVL